MRARMLVSLGLGAAAMYLFDPRTGRRRRALLRDQLRHVFAAERSMLGKARRDLEHRAHGAVERVRHVRRDDSDPVLAERVRAAVGRVASHTAVIEVTAGDGVVTLRGGILEDEAPRLLDQVACVAGVRRVDDQLERRRLGTVHEQVPSPTDARRAALMPGPRAIAGGAGLVLAVAARHPVARLGGLVLLARAGANRPLREIFGLRPTWVDVTKTITVDAPLERVFALWSHPDAFSRFLEHVHTVRTSAGEPRSAQWIVDGPFGRRLSFEARVTRFEQDRVIAWETLPGSQVAHAGWAHFEPAGNARTRLHVHLRYQPPAGLLGHALARVLGCDPKSRLDEDLVRAKALLERGYTRAHHHRVVADELVPPFS